jgi:hypothetical protein
VSHFVPLLVLTVMRIIGKVHASVVAYAIVLAEDMEAVRVGTSSPHGELERVVQIRDRVVTTQEQSPPDQGADPPQHHAEVPVAVFPATGRIAA